MTSNIKFLLVDDLEANLIALEALLRRDGLELLKARSGPEALEILLLHEIALAFVDVQMPGMSGFELAEIMRSTERTRGVPIIFLTAGVVDPQRRIRGFETGAIDFLPKPIDPANLLNKSATFYELARQRMELRASEERLIEANVRLAHSNAELERADRSKDEFIAMLAHELRNPLAPLLTGVDLLLRSTSDPAVIKKISHMMKRQVVQMSRLIDDLLDVSRITTGKIEIRKAAVKLEDVVGQAVESVEPLMEKFQHQLEIADIPAGLSLIADRHRLAQVISNLLSNSAKYTPAGGRIRLEASITPDERIRIAVSDNGSGINLEHQSTIFDLFDQGIKGPKDGLGIGLTLVRSLVQLHGGTITVFSEGEGCGSEFTIELPGVISETPAVPQEPEPPPPAPPSKRVLIADDGKSTANILGMFFQMEGMDAVVTYDGVQAIAEAKRFCPDLVCLDLGMPEIDGYDAARQIREICPTAYIVALSGWGSEDDRRRTAAAGFDDHRTKPVKPDDLRDLIAKIASR